MPVLDRVMIVPKHHLEELESRKDDLAVPKIVYRAGVPYVNADDFRAWQSQRIS